MQRLPCKYDFSKKAWMTRFIFEDYMDNLNSMFATQKRKVCFILDNFSGHILSKDFEHIKFVFLPPGTTSVLQPLDCGIINSFKCKYRHVFLDDLVNDSNDKKIRIRDMINFSSQAWNDVTAVTIKNCWLKADITSLVEYSAADTLLSMSV
jgi:hypothetical protein